MMIPKHKLSDILRSNEEYIRNGSLNAWQRRTLYALMRCRTSDLGGHIDKCNHADCGYLHISYNSCRNRHCPQCQGHKTEQWIIARQADLLPVPYYHLVFTLPSELNNLALYKPAILYSTLFKAAWSTVKGFGSNPKYLGAKAGMIAILHTWGQNLSLHPHLHCIVPGGGVTKSGSWKSVKKEDKFLYPVKEMSKVFRAKFVAELRKRGIRNQSLFTKLFSKDWVVYAKKPFKHASHIVEYLGRYTHKIAISNHRLTSVSANEICFTAKNYRKNGKQEILRLAPEEFIRRFALHILPKQFVRMRHYGFLSSSGKRIYLQKLKDELGEPKILTKTPKYLHLLCPKCKKGHLKTVSVFDSRAPPKYWIDRMNAQFQYK